MLKKIVLTLAISLLSLPAIVTANAGALAGHWKLNLEESDKVSVSYEKGSGAGRSKVLQNISMTVMGLPLPTRTRTFGQSHMAPKNPAVLLCNQMQIEPQADRIALTYDADKETLRKGHYRGRDSNWSKKKIEQKYKTPDRRVTKTWTLRADGRLLVEVKINPPKDKARTYRRVFDKATPPSQ
jgi:hypothetical protein